MVDFAKIQEKWQEKWAEAKIFEPKIDNSKPKFFYTTPYPYISGSLHIGHARAVIESDIFVRHKRMKGINVLFPLAFHITGTPVLGISAAIEKGDQKKIDLYKGYVRAYIEDEVEVEKTVNSFKEPQKIVDFFVPKMMGEYTSLGLSIDWSRRFTSGDPDYQKFITWQFNKYKDKNYLIRGSYPVLFCPGCGNAVGEDDIQDADTDPVTKQDFIWGKFKLKDTDLIIMAGTTRPDAFYGQTHLWIDPDATYKIVKVKDEKWVVGDAAVEKIKHHYEKDNPELVGEIHATELMGKWTRGPLVDYDTYIVPAWFIDANVGSGIVYSALEDPVDLFELKKIHDNMDLVRQYKLDENVIAKLKPISIINIPGMGTNLGGEIGKEFGVESPNDKKKIEEAKHELNKRVFRKGVMKENCGECAGMTVQDAQKFLKNHLIENNEAIMFYETSREAHCRCGSKVVISVLNDQWFLDFNAKGWKDAASECLDLMEIVPDIYRKQFEDTFEWLDKRPAARRRGLGTPLPFDKNWIIESLSDSTIYMSFYIVKKHINKFNLLPEQLTLSFFDYVFLGEGSVEDVSKETGIPLEAINETKENFDYWYPNDHRHTYPAHLSNHLSFFIFAHSGIFDKKCWPKKISFHGMVVSKGIKMSKSKGNVITLLTAKEKLGSDVFRFYMSNSSTVEGTFDWTESIAQTTKKNIENLVVQMDEIIESCKEGEVTSSSAKAFLSKFESAINEADNALNNMKLREYTNIVVFQQLNNLRELKKHTNEAELAAVYNKVIERWVKMLMPVLPHIAEELWHKLGNKSFVSLESWPEYDESRVDKAMESSEDTIRKTKHDIRAVMTLAKINSPEKITIIISSEWKYNFFKIIKEMLEKTRDVKQIIGEVMQTDLKKYGQDITKLIPKLVKDPSKLPFEVVDQATELNALEEAKEVLASEFSASIEIVKAEESKEQKAKQSMPSKPAILVE
jgi:leucyl-tRNA synthetase